MGDVLVDGGAVVVIVFLLEGQLDVGHALFQGLDVLDLVDVDFFAVVDQQTLERHLVAGECACLVGEDLVNPCHFFEDGLVPGDAALDVFVLAHVDAVEDLGDV